MTLCITRLYILTYVQWDLHCTYVYTCCVKLHVELILSSHTNTRTLKHKHTHTHTHTHTYTNIHTYVPPPSHTHTHTHTHVHRYVVRRILRRGVRYCTEKLGAKPGVFASLVLVVVETLVSLALKFTGQFSICIISLL